MKHQRADLVAIVQRERTRSGRGRVRFNERAREAAVEHVRRQLAQGGSVKGCAREMGIAYETLRRWLRDAKRVLRPVRVEPAAMERGSSVVVALPGGARVEGLDVGGIAELCRLLR